MFFSVFKRTTLIFSILVGYIILQFLWWEILLVKQSNEIIREKQKLVALSSSNLEVIKKEVAALEYQKNRRVYMIAGEGTVFLLTLLFGIYLVRRSVKKETQLANQHTNFTLSVSHELKTPIAASKLQLQTLLKHDLSRDKQIQLLTSALTETERLHKLVDNVLLVNQLENRNASLQKEVLNLSELIAHTTNRYFSKYIENNTLSLALEEGIFYSGDKDLMLSVIINLIENAINYSFETMAVSVSLKNIGQHAVLEIADQGCGIPDKEKEQVFHKFYRSGHEDQRKTKGTGIGLYIVKVICELHQAKISISNNYPKGSIFRIQF